MTRSIPLILLMGCCAISQLNARTIQGVILSSEDSTPIGGAECILMCDTTVLSTAVADTQGAFTLQTDLNRELSLTLSAPRYATTSVIIENGAKNLNLGTIMLDPGTDLQELTVTAGSVIHSKGRTIVYPSGADVRASATSLSLFQKLPLAGLEANPINRSIAVDGGTPVILINGVPSTLTDLNALQPKDIEKIEYSRFTPARYADKGNSGYINITLRQRDDGGNIYAWGRSALTTAFVDADIKGSYHQGPSQFSLLYSPSWRNYQKVYDHITQSYIAPDFRVNLESSDRNPFNYQYHNIRFKYDYIPNTRTFLSATFSASPSTNNRRSIAHNYDSQLGEYDNDNLSRSTDFSPSLDLFLHHDFNDRNTLEVQVVGTLSDSKYRRENRYTYPDGNTESYIMDVDSRRRSLISEVSYTHTFSDRTSLSAGYQNTVSHSTNRYLTTDYEPVLTENNNYAYARLGQSIGNFYMTLSTGLKMFWIHNDTNRRHFIRNLSSAQVAWHIDSHWNLQGSFQYIPSIPGLSTLTDYAQQVSPYLVMNGSPDMKGSERFSYTLGCDYTYRKFNISYSATYLTVPNTVITEVTYLGDKLFLSRSVNARYARTFGNSLSMRISDLYGFGANLTMGLYHYSTAGPSWTQRLTSFSGSLYLWWNHGDWTISYWRKLPGKYLMGQTVGKDENGDALQIEWRPDKHWTIGASWMYMFASKGTQYPTWDYSPVNPSTRERYISNNANMVVLSLTYTADFGSLFRQGRRKLNNSDTNSSLLKL